MKIRAVFGNAENSTQRRVAAPKAKGLAERVLFAAIKFAGEFLIDNHYQWRVFGVALGEIASRYQRRFHGSEISWRNPIARYVNALIRQRIGFALLQHRPDFVVAVPQR